MKPDAMTAAALREARAAVGRAATAIDLVSITGGRPLLEDDPKAGFRNIGEFAAAVRRASGPSGSVNSGADERLKFLAAAPTTVGSELTLADGGAAVPPDFAREIWTFAAAEDALLPLCDVVPISGNSMLFPTDQTLPWGSTGVSASWQIEATALAQLKPKLSNDVLRMSKLLAFVPLTDELLTDSASMAAWLPLRAGVSVRAKLNEAILFGRGNGTPIGALNGNAAITIAKESGQASSTFAAANFQKMAAALPPGSFGRAVWLIGQDAVAALLGVNFGSFPIYPATGSPPPGMSGPVGLVLGRPMFQSQHAAAFSSLGDVLLLDLSYYFAIVKRSGPEVQMSLHLWFDSDAAAFRFSFRVDGQPKISTPLTPLKGSNQMSPFVQLAAR
jgi:HK97 family phage major capsid protein